MLLKVKSLNKTFEIDHQKTPILNDLSFSLDFNEISSITLKGKEREFQI